MKVIYRMKGEDYHSIKQSFKSARESLNFKFTGKWNGPTKWEHPNGTMIEGTFVRMEIDGKEQTISATLTLSGDEFDFIQECRKSFDSALKTKGEEPKITQVSAPKDAPSDVQHWLHCFDLIAQYSIHEWAMPNSAGWMMPDSTILLFQNMERKRQKEKFYSYLIDIKEHFPNTDLTKLKEPSYLNQSNRIITFNPEGEEEWNRAKWEW